MALCLSAKINYGHNGHIMENMEKPDYHSEKINFLFQERIHGFDIPMSFVYCLRSRRSVTPISMGLFVFGNHWICNAQYWTSVLRYCLLKVPIPDCSHYPFLHALPGCTTIHQVAQSSLGCISTISSKRSKKSCSSLFSDWPLHFLATAHSKTDEWTMEECSVEYERPN